jgi:hypothetical protein
MSSEPDQKSCQHVQAFAGSLNRQSFFVMAGFVPAIHVFLLNRSKDVDARHKAGHDELLESDSWK